MNGSKSEPTMRRLGGNGVVLTPGEADVALMAQVDQTLKAKDAEAQARDQAREGELAGVPVEPPSKASTEKDS